MITVEDLVQWLRAQLDEDETTARRATVRQAGGGVWAYDGSDVQAESGLGVARRIVPVHGEHIARHDPARVLREIDAKRQLMERIFRYEAKIDGEWGCCHDAEEIEAGQCEETPPDEIEALRLLALPYADREGYREEWRP